MVLIIVGLAAWAALAVLVGLVLGRVIRLRDRDGPSRDL